MSCVGSPEPRVRLEFVIKNLLGMLLGLLLFLSFSGGSGGGGRDVLDGRGGSGSGGGGGGSLNVGSCGVDSSVFVKLYSG